MMQQQTQNTHTQHQLHQPHLSLSNKPKLSQYNAQQLPNHIIYGIANRKYTIIDLQKLNKIYESPQEIHSTRIGCLRYKDNILISGGYDHKVKLFDYRNNSLIHTFDRTPGEFNAVDKSQHILVGASSSNVIFWDLRKMKQRSEFRDSFNDQITFLQFDMINTVSFAACSLDGMVSSFDLRQPNEQDAFSWCHKVMESPKNIAFCEQKYLVQTCDHNLYKIEQGDFIGKISPNHMENPKHIMRTKMTKQGFYQYCTWSPSEQVLEHWSGKFRDNNNEQNCLGYINGVTDAQIVNFIENGSNGGKYVIWVDENGRVHTDKFGKQKNMINNIVQQQKVTNNNKLEIVNTYKNNNSNSSKKLIKTNKNIDNNNKLVDNQMVNDESIPQMNKNGYLLQKPKSFLKGLNKRNKPY